MGLRGVASLPMVAAVGTLLLLSMGPPILGANASAVPPRGLGEVNPRGAASVPLDHIIIVMQENHVYDDYFGTYCLTLGVDCTMNATGIPPGTCVPLYPANTAAGCIQPYRYGWANVTTPTDMLHNWVSAHQAYDNGSLDGFYQAEGLHLSTFGYYDGSLLPTYWDLAEQYGLGDNMFASVLSYSTPNHWYLVAGTSPPEGVNQTLHKARNSSALTPNEQLYLNQSNSTETIADLLMNSSVSWDYYDYPLASYGTALSQPSGAGETDSAFDYWNPFAAKASSYTPAYSSHLVSSSQFFTDAAAGRLPNVSWVLPTFNNSDHPPASLVNGESWVDSIVNAVERSPDWNTSAIFVAWDDYGGYFDHQPPPAIDANGVSLRSPFLVIGPYVRENFVSHRFEYFESLLHLIEWRFHLPSLTNRDRFAPLPLEYFDFAGAPRAPITVPGPSSATYPMRLQGLGPPPGPTGLSAAAGPGSVTLNWTVPAHTAPITAYELSYGPRTFPNASALRIDGSLSSITVSNLIPGAAYTFTLAAITPGNTSATASLVATPGYGAPVAVPSSVPTWESLPIYGTGPVPGPRTGAVFGYDAADHYDVLFGGRSPAGALLNDTWIYSRQNWTVFLGAIHPSARAFAAAATLSSSGAIVLFGGLGASGYLSDTWRFLDGRWTNVTYLSASLFPTARGSATLTDDPADGYLVLFGGRTASGLLSDTWAYGNGHWKRITVTGSSPSGRLGAAATYDPSNAVVDLFGGKDATGTLLNDTWRYSGGRWTAVPPGPAPPARANASFVYDQRDQEGILVGGITTGGTVSGQTWALTGTHWRLLHPTTPSGAITGASAFYDGLHQAVVLGFGTNGSATFSSLHAFSPPTSVRLIGSPTYIGAGGNVFFAPAVSGGLGPNQYLWDFGDGGRSPLLNAWHLFAGPGNYTVQLTVIDGGGVATTVAIPVYVSEGRRRGQPGAAVSRARRTISARSATVE